MFELAVIIVLILLLIVILVTQRSANVPNVFKDYYYFDANATTPINDDALDVLNKSIRLGNASTDYAMLSGASNIITTGQDLVKRILNAPDWTIVFNSGCSEGNSYVFRTVADIGAPGTGTPHVIVSAIEHKSILACVESLTKAGRLEATLIQPTVDGLIDPVSVAEAIRPSTVLISIMHANNETGTINPIRELGAVAKKYGVLFHTDAAQSFCKFAIDVQADGLDIVTSSIHKVYGPTGTGIIAMSPRVAAYHVAQISGTQFGGLRGGTENLASIAASITAMTKTISNRPAKNARLLALKTKLLTALSTHYQRLSFATFSGLPDSHIPSSANMLYSPKTILPKVCFTVLGDQDRCLPGCLLISFFKVGNYTMDQRFCNIKLKEELFKRKIIISIGSACNTHNAAPSHVLVALRAPFVIRSGVIRISFTDHTTDAHMSYFIKNLTEAINMQLPRGTTLRGE